MKTRYIVLLIAVAVALLIKVIQWFWKRRIVFGGSEESPMFFAAGGNKQIEAATKKARETLDNFTNELKNTTGDFEGSVKVKVVDGHHVEYIWLDKLSYDHGIFRGTINNDPQLVKTIKFGDPWQADGNDIYDWVYRKDGKLYGNFTFKASLSKQSLEKQIVALKDYGDVEALREAFSSEHRKSIMPLISALAETMTPDQMIESIERSSMPDEKKKEMIQRLRDKAQKQQRDKLAQNE